MDWRKSCFEFEWFFFFFHLNGFSYKFSTKNENEFVFSEFSVNDKIIDRYANEDESMNEHKTM